MFLFGAVLLYFSYIAGPGLSGHGSAPDVGWFAYAPLTGRAFSRGNSTDYWTLSLLLSGVGSLSSSVNVVATVFGMRSPGMTLMRMPLFVWMMVVVSAMILMVLPPLTAAQIMLLLDRYLGANFFNTQSGGSAVLWQHFFWIFGHPEVYILMIPGFACASEIIPVFSRKPIFGYSAMVAATTMIAFVSMGVWAHHMFSVGMTSVGNTFFMISTMLISVPTGIKIFNWLATMYGGKIRLELPMLCCLAFLFQFLIAGLTGIMLAAVPFIWRNLLLVSEGHRANVEQEARPLACRPVLHRIPPDLRHNAHTWTVRHAATDLHIRLRARLGDLESDHFHRSHVSNRRHCLSGMEHPQVGAQGRKGGR